MKSLFIIISLLVLSHSQWAGITVSESQGAIMWEKVKIQKYFAIIRAGFGTMGVDKMFAVNYKLAKEAGVNLGAYLYSFAESVEDAKEEANHFLSLLKDKKFEWPVYINIEEKSIFDKGICNDVASAFCSIMEANRYYCGLFTTVDSLNKYFNADVRGKYTIWVAHWDVPRPKYYESYHVWERSNKEGCPGIRGVVPQNVGYVDFGPIMKKAHLNGY